MRQKIFRNTGMLLGITVLLAFLVILGVYYGQFSKQIKQTIKNEAQYVKVAVEDIGSEYLDKEVGNASNTRITLIDTDGVVLYDSVEDAKVMENHSNRPEFIEAQETGAGESKRLSATLGDQTFYYAIRLSNGQILRVACVTDSIFRTLTSSFTLMILLLIVVLVVALVLTHYQTRKLVAPINELDLEQPLENEVYEELTPLLRRIDKQNHLIQDQVKKIKTNHEEYLAITENMKDGMIITNKTAVLGINKAALNMFHVTTKECLHKNILKVSRNQTLKEAVDKALSGEANEALIEIDGKVLQILANPVSIQENHMGAVILLLDITEKQKVENMRREFSANVSHELKTPLMSISGYAELLKNNMVRQEDIPEFSNRIYNEASRLTTLVEDIIKLSQLDEKNSQMKQEMVDLYSVTKDVCSCLKMPASKRNVQVTLEGESAVLFGVRQVLYEMIFNLCDNAIKYNKENGEVFIQVENKGNQIMWSVKDTGIGIPEEEQERIFERFYRVDKSHSRDTGGTGLGLSIVKHGVILHKGSVRVESVVGEGTKITMLFENKLN